MSMQCGLLVMYFGSLQHTLEFEFLILELDRTKRNLSSLKDQSEGTIREYDRLLQEHEKLQVGCILCKKYKIFNAIIAKYGIFCFIFSVNFLFQLYLFNYCL